VEWFDLPWKKITIEYWKEQMDHNKHIIDIVNGDMCRPLQYILSHDLDYANRLLNNVYYDVKSVNEQGEVIIELICKEEYSQEEIETRLVKMASSTVSHVLPLDKIQINRIPQHPASQIKGKAVVIYGHKTLFCLARDDEVLDELLFHLGYCEQEEVTLKKKEINLRALGLEKATLHPNLHKVEVVQNATTPKCVFTWRGRKKVQNAIELIDVFKKNCRKERISFCLEDGYDWTHLAIELMFESGVKLKEVYFQLFKKLLYKSSLNRYLHCVLQHSDQQIWMYSYEDEEFVKKLKCNILSSISLHRAVRKDIFGRKDMKEVLSKHEKKIKCDVKKGTIICTSDVDIDIIQVLSTVSFTESKKQLAQGKVDQTGVQQPVLKSAITSQHEGNVTF